MFVRLCIVTLLFALTVIFSNSGTCSADTTSLISVADNFGTGPGDGSIVGLGPAGNPNVDAYHQAGTGTRTFAIEFDLATLPVDHTLISSATLQLTAPSFVNPVSTIDLNGYAGNGIIDLADVQGLNNIGLLHSGILMSTVGSIDVSAFIQARVAAGSTHAGFMATSLSPITAHPHVYSREWSIESERPTLFVTTVPEPSVTGILFMMAAVCSARRRRR